MSEHKPVIFIVDDDEVIRNTIGQLAESVDLQAKKFASAQEFLDSCSPDQPGCLILDIRMPGMSGIQLQAKLIEKDIHIPIIFITGHGDVQMAVKAVRNGAVDFIEKPFRNQVLLDRIQEALARDTHLRRKRSFQKAGEEKLKLLTAREQQVLDLVKIGTPNKNIATMLGVSLRTVEGHRANIMEKLKVQSVAELVTFIERIQPAEEFIGCC
jgi:FixJ family two-component response regulator